jgi:hypothetical protein
LKKISLGPVVTKVFSTEQWIFQDGNAPTAVQWKQENNILGMTWPAQSPAINVIENIWRYMKIRLPQVVHRIKLNGDKI